SPLLRLDQHQAPCRFRLALCTACVAPWLVATTVVSEQRVLVQEEILNPQGCMRYGYQRRVSGDVGIRSRARRNGQILARPPSALWLPATCGPCSDGGPRSADHQPLTAERALTCHSGSAAKCHYRKSALTTLERGRDARH